MTSINPYLNFAGNCEEAFEFYRAAFGGDYSSLQRFSDGPPDMPVAPGDADKIMHVSLPLGEGQVLMGSDQPSDRGGVNAGNSVSISISPETTEEGHRLFAALAEGGTVVMPYERQFWDADYGMCIDRFGIGWMVNYEYGEG